MLALFASPDVRLIQYISTHYAQQTLSSIDYLSVKGKMLDVL